MRHSRTAHHALVLAAFFVAVASVAPASAQIDPGNTNPVAAKDTGMFGLTASRVARIDAVNLGGRMPGTVNLQFFDEAGNIVGEKFITLGPGESGNLELTPPVGQTGRMSIRARAMVLDDSREGTATRCGRLIRVSAIIFSPDTGQTLRKVRVIHRDLGVCADKGRRAAAPVVP